MNRVAFVPGLLACLIFGCEPQIGDPCDTAVDCLPNADSCLTESFENFPGGYCSTLGCSTASCGEGAACVVFRASIGNSAACQGPLFVPRQARSFCMARCSSDEDCRDGYACLDLGRTDDAWSAEVLDFEGGTRVCTVAAPEVDDSDPRQSDVCDTRGAASPVLDAGLR